MGLITSLILQFDIMFVHVWVISLNESTFKTNQHCGAHGGILKVT